MYRPCGKISASYSLSNLSSVVTVADNGHIMSVFAEDRISFIASCSHSECIDYHVCRQEIITAVCFNKDSVLFDLFDLSFGQDLNIVLVQFIKQRLTGIGYHRRNNSIEHLGDSDILALHRKF